MNQKPIEIVEYSYYSIYQIYSSAYIDRGMLAEMLRNKIQKNTLIFEYQKLKSTNE